MSNIGKNLIHIPSSLTITKLDFDLDFYTLIFYGPLGKVSINIPKYINININFYYNMLFFPSMMFKI